MKKLLIVLALLNPVKAIASPAVIIAELSGDVNDLGRQRAVRTLNDRLQAKIVLVPYEIKSADDASRVLGNADVVIYGSVERYFVTVGHYEDVGAVKLHYVTSKGYQGQHYYIFPQPGVAMPPDFENDLRMVLK